MIAVRKRVVKVYINRVTKQLNEAALRLSSTDFNILINAISAHGMLGACNKLLDEPRKLKPLLKAKPRRTPLRARRFASLRGRGVQ